MSKLFSGEDRNCMRLSKLVLRDLQFHCSMASPFCASEGNLTDRVSRGMRMKQGDARMNSIH